MTILSPAVESLLQIHNRNTALQICFLLMKIVNKALSPQQIIYMAQTPTNASSTIF